MIRVHPPPLPLPYDFEDYSHACYDYARSPLVPAIFHPFLPSTPA